MALTIQETTVLNWLGSRWWKGPDPGEEVEITISFRRPVARTDQEVVDLFMELLEPLSGGYPYRTSIPLREEPGSVE